MTLSYSESAGPRAPGALFLVSMYSHARLWAFPPFPPFRRGARRSSLGVVAAASRRRSFLDAARRICIDGADHLDVVCPSFARSSGSVACRSTPTSRSPRQWRYSVLRPRRPGAEHWAGWSARGGAFWKYIDRQPTGVVFCFFGWIKLCARGLHVCFAHIFLS